MIKLIVLIGGEFFRVSSDEFCKFMVEVDPKLSIFVYSQDYKLAATYFPYETPRWQIAKKNPLMISIYEGIWNHRRTNGYNDNYGAEDYAYDTEDLQTCQPRT